MSRKNGDSAPPAKMPMTSRMKVIVSGRISSTCQRGRGGAASCVAGGIWVSRRAHARALLRLTMPCWRTVRSMRSATRITAP